MSQNQSFESLYSKHVQMLRTQTEQALTAAGYDSLVVYSGTQPMLFLDDQAYPFKVNPHFKHWAPVVNNPDCFIYLVPGQRPQLLFHQPVDYWHKPPATPQDHWTREFDLQPVADLNAARAALPSSLKRTALIGEATPEIAAWGFGETNSQVLLNSLHFIRAVKDDYEIECIRRATMAGARGHRAAEQAFRSGGSEFDAHMAYLSACGQREEELPYNSIVAINANAAVLHYQHLERLAPLPTERRSFLIDAGATYNGYACDITRTYAARDSDFANLIVEMDRLQLRLCASLKAGVDWRDFQRDTHRGIAQVLKDADVIRCDAGAAVDNGLSAIFFPHGVGHLLGLQVHDVGGFMRDASGTTIDKPHDQPYLRLTRQLETGFVVTVEPGLYFIDSLLNSVRDKDLGKLIDWQRVDEFRPYGGIRIEDNVVIEPHGHRNLTREIMTH